MKVDFILSITDKHVKHDEYSNYEANAKFFY